MINTAVSQSSFELIRQWWHNCSSTACSLPKEHTQEWLNLISEVVRNYRLLTHCTHPSDQRFYRKLCQEALVKSRWELMLISMYGYIPQDELHSLEALQTSLEQSLAD